MTDELTVRQSLREVKSAWKRMWWRREGLRFLVYVLLLLGSVVCLGLTLPLRPEWWQILTAFGQFVGSVHVGSLMQGNKRHNEDVRGK